MFSTTYCCITLHMHAYLFNFLLFDSGEDGGVGSLTKEQCFTWARKTHYYTDTQHQGCAGQRYFISIPITLTVTLSSPDIDLTITLIRLLTGSKFNTWSNSYLKDVRRGNKRCNLNTNNNWDFKKKKRHSKKWLTYISTSFVLLRIFMVLLSRPRNVKPYLRSRQIKTQMAFMFSINIITKLYQLHFP